MTYIGIGINEMCHYKAVDNATYRRRGTLINHYISG